MTGLKADITGLLPRESPFDEVLQAIETVLDGQPYLIPRITGLVVDKRVRWLRKPVGLPELSAALALVLAERQRRGRERQR